MNWKEPRSPETLWSKAITTATDCLPLFVKLPPIPPGRNTLFLQCSYCPSHDHSSNTYLFELNFLLCTGIYPNQSPF